MSTTNCRRYSLREITQDFLGSVCPFTHASGSQPIDGVWATEDITITVAVKWLTFEESPGDHRACVFEFTMQSAIGDHEKKIVYPGKSYIEMPQKRGELLRRIDKAIRDSPC